jgi:hypothetical protein
VYRKGDDTGFRGGETPGGQKEDPIEDEGLDKSLLYGCYSDPARLGLFQNPVGFEAASNDSRFSNTIIVYDYPQWGIARTGNCRAF